MASDTERPVLPRGRKRRRTGGDTPIDFSSFPDDSTLLVYISNLAFHIRRGVGGMMLQQYEAAFAEAQRRGIDVVKVARPPGAR